MRCFKWMSKTLVESMVNQILRKQKSCNILRDKYLSMQLVEIKLGDISDIRRIVLKNNINGS